MLKKYVFLLFLATLVLSSSAWATWGPDNSGGGSSDGGSGQVPGTVEAASPHTQQVISVVKKYIAAERKESEGGGNCDELLRIVGEGYEKIDGPYKGVTLYFVGGCYFKKGNYDKAKAIIKKILSEDYDSITDLMGNREKVRTLAVAMFSKEAAKKGRVEDIEEIETMVGKDALLDRTYIRDKKGKLVSRTKLSYLIKFHEAQAYKNSGNAKKALGILKELEFSSGKIIVNKEVEGVRDAASRLIKEIDGTKKS